MNELKCAFPTHKRASAVSTPCIRVRASKRELPTIAAHIVPSSTVNQGGVRVRAIVKVSNKFRCASRESRRVIRKIDFPRRASDVGALSKSKRTPGILNSAIRSSRFSRCTVGYYTRFIAHFEV